MVAHPYVEEYLSAICPISNTVVPGAAGNTAGSVLADGGLSKAQLEAMPLGPRMHALFAHGKELHMITLRKVSIPMFTLNRL